MKHLKQFESNEFKMNPIFTKQVVYSVDSSDLAGFILNIYGRDPEIEASLELGHDDTFEISANADESDEDDFNEWLKNPRYDTSEIYAIMNKLAADGHIENGDYLIKTY